MLEGIALLVCAVLLYQLLSAEADEVGPTAVPAPVELAVLSECDLGRPLGQLRAVPVNLGKEQPGGLLLVHSAHESIDPWWPYFSFPTDTLKFTMTTESGQILWMRELGAGVVPGVWFAPVFPFDLDGDGREEIWFVNNLDERHPFAIDSASRVLERLDARTGETTGRWPWPGGITPRQSLSDLFRFFIFGGHAQGEPVLVTAQGSYLDMSLQGWNPDLSVRWKVTIGDDAPGARGSHTCAITDLDGDGSQEFMWGERCLDFDSGRELFCADREVYRGHSDVVQPIWDDTEGRWLILTCREKDPEASPRVVMFDGDGWRVWGDVGAGHLHSGGVARLAPDGRLLAWAFRLDDPSELFIFDARTGRPVTSPGIGSDTFPVDLDGDGLMELASASGRGTGTVADREGRVLACYEGRVVTAGRLTSRPGEQLVTYTNGGTVRILGWPNAKDLPQAKARWEHPLYPANRRLLAVGYNVRILGAFQPPRAGASKQP